MKILMPCIISCLSQGWKPPTSKERLEGCKWWLFWLELEEFEFYNYTNKCALINTELVFISSSTFMAPAWRRNSLILLWLIAWATPGYLSGYLFAVYVYFQFHLNEDGYKFQLIPYSDFTFMLHVHDNLTNMGFMKISNLWFWVCLQFDCV